MPKIPAPVPPGVVQPRSGRFRLPCNEPCEVVSFEGRSEGRVWNVSVAGTYVVLPPTSLPALGQKVLLSFTVPGDDIPITCEARVQWHNVHSAFKAAGSTQPALPPGCGLSFVTMDGGDAARLERRLTAARPA